MRFVEVDLQHDEASLPLFSSRRVMGLCALLQSHWSVERLPKSPRQIDAEAFLLCVPSPFACDAYHVSHCVRFSRWHLFVAAFVTQFCVGSLYAWSVYNAYIDNYIFGDPAAGHAVVAFYLACGSLGLSAAILGPWLERTGPRFAIAVGATLFLIGHIGAGLGIYYKSMALVYVAYGGIVGAGIGICYISPVATLQKWFPDLRGTAGGFAVCGFGAGPVLWALLFPYPIKVWRTPVYLSFMMFGAGISLILYACAIVMRTPPPGFSVRGKDMHGIHRARGRRMADAHENVRLPRRAPNGNVILFVPVVEVTTIAHPHEYYRESEMDDSELFYFQRIKQLPLVACVTSPEFALLWVMFFLKFRLDMDLYLFSANVTAFTPDDVNRAERMVSYNGLFNFAGRLVVPTASDLLIRGCYVHPADGRKLIFLFILVVQGCIALVLQSALEQKNHGLFQTLVWLLTFVYGGGFGTIPCFLCDMFGAFNIGALHGIILTCWSIAGVGGGLGFTSIFDAAIKTQSTVAAYGAAMPLFSIGAAVGIVALLLVRTSPVDRFAPGYQFSIGRLTLCHFGRRNAKTSQQPRAPTSGRVTGNDYHDLPSRS
ncbi:hypothetical protein SPRG_14699 [Saprolegnia parasitica CBS 223.65]|uniref:Major facilitator superfamily (MFS) profile domain-containing protein n=1 Tax=Saprolegnia parasitica (strain CBS 223.65) TaxID=695850 RepID=A0A067BXL7_SAPPC|nr:hypothetical protein SPRG_14699 [Saprolegnia parasitica CBS 223.65]KDO19307.1 hypothetical protein SPRG_14699 [Saprolegnia parasitica CBS 223.65]|eukprot:XP_012209981.1 hypothetical protein SPRG_14699 [Saprolegnia parasitica CBS 223.65]